MYGMSAKDRLSMFEKKADDDDTSKSGPKKIGKLNISGAFGKKEPEKTPVLKKTPAKKALEKKEADKAEKEKKTMEKKDEILQCTKVEPTKAKEEPNSKPKDEPKKTDSEKLKEEPKKIEPTKQEEEAKNAEAIKPKEEPKKVESAKQEEPVKVDPATPKKEPKKDEPTKQKEDTKNVELVKPKKVERAKQVEPEKVEPATPKEETKKVESAKPKEEPKKFEPAKPKEEPKKVEAATPKEEPKKVEPAKPKEEPKKVEPAKPKEELDKLKPEKSKEEPNEVEPIKAKDEQTNVEIAEHKEDKNKATKLGPTLVVDDLDLDSELEANLDLMSDVELQSPTAIPAGPLVKIDKSKKHNEAEEKTIPKQTEVHKITEPSKVVIENIQPTDMELKSTQVTVSMATITEIPKSEVELTTKSVADNKTDKTTIAFGQTAKPAPAETKNVQPTTFVAEETKQAVQPAKTAPAENTQVVQAPKTITETKQNAQPAKTMAIETAKAVQSEKPAANSSKQEVIAKAVEKEGIEQAPVNSVISPAKIQETATLEAEDKEVSDILNAVIIEETAPAPKFKMPHHDFKPIPEEFFNTIFYFSGMGTVVGSALAEGVYVAENNARISLDDEEVNNARRAMRREEADKNAVIKTARGQACDITIDLRHLQNLLDSLPTFVNSGVDTQPLVRPSEKPLRGLYIPPIAMVDSGRNPAGRAVEEHLPWVKQEPEHAQQIPTWHQQVEEGLAMIGQQADKPPHQGIIGQPFVPPAWHDKSSLPATPSAYAPAPDTSLVSATETGSDSLPQIEERLTAPASTVKFEMNTEESDKNSEPSQAEVLSDLSDLLPEPAHTDSVDTGQIREDMAENANVPSFVTAPSLPPPMPATCTSIQVQQSPSQQHTSFTGFPAKATSTPPRGGVAALPFTPQVSSPRDQSDSWRQQRSISSPLPPAKVDGGAIMTPSSQPMGRLAPKENQPMYGPVRPYGVYTGDISHLSKQPWQDRYGKKKKADEIPQTRSLYGSVDSRGLKTWQLSRLRTLEAQGYDIKQPDDYDTYAHMKNTQSENDLSSLAPFLVSNRSKQADFQSFSGQTKGVNYQKFYAQSSRPVEHIAVSSGSFSPRAAVPKFKLKSKSISTPGFRSVSAPMEGRAGTFQPVVNASLPYCDL